MKLVEMYMNKVMKLPSWIQDLLAHCLIYAGYLATSLQLNVFPAFLRDELMGIRSGCKAEKVHISKSNLWMLNTGADFLCGIVYNMMLPENTPKTIIEFLDWILAKIKELLKKKEKLIKLPKALARLPSSLGALLGHNILNTFDELKVLVEKVKQDPTGNTPLNLFIINFF